MDRVRADQSLLKSIRLHQVQRDVSRRFVSRPPRSFSFVYSITLILFLPTTLHVIQEMKEEDRQATKATHKKAKVERARVKDVELARKLLRRLKSRKNMPSTNARQRVVPVRKQAGRRRAECWSRETFSEICADSRLAGGGRV